jgi:hypothetical protein
VLNFSTVLLALDPPTGVVASYCHGGIYETSAGFREEPLTTKRISERDSNIPESELKEPTSYKMPSNEFN